MKKVFKIIFNGLIGVFVACMLFVLIINVTSKNTFPTIGRYSLFCVKGDSMYPVIKNGDLIIVDNKQSKYEINDIISFVNSENVVVTHQIIEVINDDGQYKYMTKGINNNNGDGDYVLENEIIGKYAKIRIPLLGFVISFVNSTIGYILFIVCPIGVMLFIAVYELLKEINKKKGEL